MSGEQATWDAVVHGLVRLSWVETHRAAQAGFSRRLEAIRSGRVHRHKLDSLGFNEDAVGAIGEMAAAKLLNRFWSPGLVPDKDEGDVDGLGVRTTMHSDGRLVVHRDDPDRQKMVLVRWQKWNPEPTFEVAGWLLAAEAKRDEFWRSDIRSPCFMVPAQRLRPVATL
jgi:hypothetical protein